MGSSQIQDEGDITGSELRALREYLEDQAVATPGCELSVNRIRGGRSNLTYTITDGISDWILRSPPRTGATPTAHDVAREFRIMALLADTEVPVPRMEILCQDLGVIGVPFVLMERVHGPIWRGPEDILGASPEVRLEASESLVDTLASLHTIDPGVLGERVVELGRTYLERQVSRWTGQWSHWKSREVPAVERLAELLLERMPNETRVSLVHGDYRFDNVVLHTNGVTRVKAVLDWELSTVGDPLADLGSLIAFWGRPGVRPVMAHQEMTVAPGFLTTAGIVERYAGQTGVPIDEMSVYVAFGCFRWAVIRQGILSRASLSGSVPDDVEALSDSVVEIAGRGLAVMNGDEEV